VHPPEGGEVNLGPNLQGKVVSAPPRQSAPPEAEQESDFLRKLGDLDGGRGNFGVLRATTKRSSIFWRSTPRQNPGYAYK